MPVRVQIAFAQAYINVTARLVQALQTEPLVCNLLHGGFPEAVSDHTTRRHYSFSA